jgi:tripartite-type tricarboxylate transporter receptor subunit TctC
MTKHATITIVALAVLTASANAQTDYPSRTVQLIVPYGAGGIADAGMRILADKLAGHLKQPVVVDNRPGAGGIVAAKAGAAAAPDGYTVMMTGNHNAIAVSLFKSLPYNILTDFAPTSTTSFFDLLIVTRAGSPLKSVQDVVKAARASPGKLNIATINPGSTQNLAAELFRSTAGIDATIVPFRTSPDMATAVLRGDVDIAFEFYAAVQGVLADNKMIALASTGPKRTSYLPALPTVQESGIKDFDVVSWNGISVPAATPKPVVEILSRAINAVLPSPDVQDKATRLGMEMRGSTSDEMTARMKGDIAKWAAVIEKAGIPKHE